MEFFHLVLILNPYITISKLQSSSELLRGNQITDPKMFALYSWNVERYCYGWYVCCHGSFDTLAKVVLFIDGEVFMEEDKKPIWIVFDLNVLEGKSFTEKFEYIHDILYCDGYCSPGDDYELDMYRCGNDKEIVAVGSTAHCKHYLNKVIAAGTVVGVEDTFDDEDGDDEDEGEGEGAHPL